MNTNEHGCKPAKSDTNSAEPKGAYFGPRQDMRLNSSVIRVHPWFQLHPAPWFSRQDAAEPARKMRALRAANLPIKPGARVGPVTLGRRARDPQHIRRFVDF